MTRGCVSNCLTINGVEENKLSEESKNIIRKELLDALKDKESLIPTNELLEFVVQYGTYDSTDTPCECCGDIIEYYSINI